jgi:enoyl-CoA hydratase
LVEKSFCCWGRYAEFAQFSVEEGTQLAAQGQDTFNFVENLKYL